MKSTTIECIALNALDRRTIAVQMALPDSDRLIFGRGSYQCDEQLGHILRIKLASDDDGEILLTESVWNGEIVPGESVGCDYLVRLS